jgi:hypothetical protein
MVLQRELAIGALEFDLSDGAAYAQHFVVVTFCVRGQNKPLFLYPICIGEIRAKRPRMPFHVTRMVGA